VRSPMLHEVRYTNPSTAKTVDLHFIISIYHYCILWQDV
jgi:hypothetical protein